MLKLKACLGVVVERCLVDARLESAPGVVLSAICLGSRFAMFATSPVILYRSHNVIL